MSLFNHVKTETIKTSSCQLFFFLHTKNKFFSLKINSQFSRGKPCKDIINSDFFFTPGRRENEPCISNEQVSCYANRLG